MSEHELYLVGHAETGCGQGKYTGDPVVTLDLYCVDAGTPGRFCMAPDDARRLGVALLESANTAAAGPPGAGT